MGLLPPKTLRSVEFLSQSLYRKGGPLTPQDLHKVAFDAAVDALLADPNANTEFVKRRIKWRITDAYRQAPQERSYPPEWAGWQRDFTTMSNEHLDFLDLIAPLSRLDKEILFHRFVLDMSVKETAETLGLTPGNVKIRQHRAVRFLQRGGGLPAL